MSRVKINVPAEYGDTLTLTYRGDVHDAKTYKVSEGTTYVEEENVALFLQAITGSSPASGPAEAAASEQGVPGSEPPQVDDPAGIANVVPGAATGKAKS